MKGKNMNAKLKCVVIALFLCAMLWVGSNCKTGRQGAAAVCVSRGEATWLKQQAFDAKLFKEPPREFGPYTRWWWPGNDVTKEELMREIDVFADNGFAGVEIQPFTRGLNPNAAKEELDRVYSWDTPGFYENLRTVLAQAKARGLIVDLNGGSGWPSGGPHVPPQDNILNLNFSAVNVTGGGKVQIHVPKVNMAHRSVAMAGMSIRYAKIDPALAKLQALIAAKIISEEPNEPVHLDPSSTVDLSHQMDNGKIDWQAPPGNWKIIAFYAYPSGEIPVLIAKKDPGLVVDHFDAAKVAANYEYLLGKRTGLEPYYGDPLRAVFNDSYEFKADRHYSLDFRSVFMRNRGYDITPWLPANMQLGYNNHAESAYFPNQKPSFYFSDEDWRLQYDYDTTLGELLQSHFFDVSRQWLESRGMLHRTQAYGLHMDILSASGNASIPETEQLFSEGSEGFIKLTTSGAHLYNRPIISAESFVYRYRAEMTTPQKLRISIDKAIAAGVNQIIYHGTPYRYMTRDFSKAGWNTWDSPFTPYVTYSSNILETDNFWQDIKEINQYIRRVQYAMRAGKPATDVLIYFPYLGVESRELMSNPEELLPLGYFKGVEPDSVIPALGAPSRKPAESTIWYHKIWPTVNQLEAAGITWEFTNDQSIQDAKIVNGKIDIRGNKYQALILAHVPHIRKASAQHIQALCRRGANLLVVGPLPEKQPSFLNYKENDRQTRQWLEAAVKEKNSRLIDQQADVAGWTAGIARKLKFATTYDFTRQIQRELGDGSRLHFIWNKSDRWQNLSLSADASYPNLYMLDAETGKIVKSEGGKISCLLPPYNAVILYAAVQPVTESLLSEPLRYGHFGQKVADIARWNIKVHDAVATSSHLFDWRTNERLKFESADGLYTSSFRLENKNSRSSYFLDMGTVYFTADVYVNGKHAGKRIFAPYELDITSFVHEGTNHIEIRVIPAPRNHSVGEALKGNPKFAQYQKLGKTLMPAGLLGPVVIRSVDHP
jgi:hypothetical protein